MRKPTDVEVKQLEGAGYELVPIVVGLGPEYLERLLTQHYQKEKYVTEDLMVIVQKNTVNNIYSLDFLEKLGVIRP